MKFFLPPYTEENIKKQYKALSKKFHPDKPGGSEKMFGELTEEKNTLLAYAALQVSDLPGKKLPTKNNITVVKARPKKIIRRTDKSIRLIFESAVMLKQFVKEIKKL